MMDEIAMLAISLLGVGLVVLLVWWLGLGQANIASETDAAEAAEALAAGFTAGSVLLDKDGRAALVADAHGDGFIILKQAGQHPCGRHLAKPNWRADADDGVVIDSADRWFGPVRIAPADPKAAAHMRLLVEQAV